MAIKCDNCAWSVVNGKYFVHESGCPTSYLHQYAKCRSCGEEFKLTQNKQQHCEACREEF